MWFKKKKKNNFLIEEYPYSGAYFVRYKDKYLYRNYLTGLIELRDFTIATKCLEFKYVMQLIDQFKEQHFKEGVKITEVEEK